MSILILGLGNIGKEYKNTRHNVGFEILDAIADELGIKFCENAKLHAEVAEINLDGQKLILAKPTTYMNKSGDALIALINAYKINKQNVWIVYDDASMQLGSIRVRAEGSSGGHNGIKSVIDVLGTQTFWRFKIGVDCPPENIPLEDWVLSKFTKEQKELLVRVVELTKETILNAVQTEPEEESEILN
jgi:PTH1 family peptidyl-tRNA hydrolase